MKNRFLNIWLIIILSTTIFAGAFIQYFSAKSDGDTIRLEWKTGEESNLKHFAVERKSHLGNFIEIGIVNPKGSNSIYQFIDNNVNKSNDLLLTYRLKIVDQNNQHTYSSEISVSHRISGLKRTWGSIKAMFR